MDRFSETSPLLDAEHRISRSSRTCPNCLRPCDSLANIPVWNFDGCELCAEESAFLLTREAEDGEPVCPVEYELLLSCASVSAMREAVETHRNAGCVFCGSRKGPAREESNPVGPAKTEVA
jgi:hypothetical protein